MDEIVELILQELNCQKKGFISYDIFEKYMLSLAGMGQLLTIDFEKL